MINIPTLKKKSAKWNFKCEGKAPKYLKSIIPEIVKFVLIHEKIDKEDLIIEIIGKNKAGMAHENKKYLNKEGPTDIISLPLDKESLDKEDQTTLLGTILFCLEEIKERAIKANKPEIKHIAHMIVHATLHLLGYTHEDEEDSKQMEGKEISILSKMSITSPY